jgi:diguanylate cyclase (GGDEF)-like protein
MQGARTPATPAALVVTALTALTAVGTAASYLVAEGARLEVACAAWTLAAVVAVVGVLARVRRSDPADRGGWRVVLAACVTWLVSQLIWDLYLVIGFPGSPNPADVLWLVFAVLAGIGVRRLAVRRSRLLSALELLPLVIAACALIAAFLWEAIRESPLSTAGVVTVLLYPGLYVSSALITLQRVVAGGIDLRRNAGVAAVLAGLVVEAIAFIIWSPQLLSNGYAAGHGPVDALWSLGMVAVGVGALTAGRAEPVPDASAVARRRAGVLPSLFFAILAVAQVVAIADDDRGPSVALAIGVGCVGATLIARASVLRCHEDALLARLRTQEQELRHVNERLSRESRVDELTGLANRLRLREDFVDLAARAARYGEGFCAVLVDLDRFKAFNDALGHQAGDDVLRRVADVLEATARDGDRIYRYGGEELLLILPEQDVASARVAAERHRAAVERVAIPHRLNAPWNVVTLSAGVAVASPGEAPDDVLRRADIALYAAKRSGRNRVEVAHVTSLAA